MRIELLHELTFFRSEIADQLHTLDVIIKHRRVDHFFEGFAYDPVVQDVRWVGVVKDGQKDFGR